MLLSWLRMLVSTSNMADRGQLEEQYGGEGSEMMVPFKRSQFLCHKVRAITYQYFNNNPPQHIQEVEALVLSLLNGHFSLDQYHATLASLLKDSAEHGQLQEHFIALQQLLQLDNLPCSSPLPALSELEQLSIYSQSAHCQTLQGFEEHVQIPPLRLTSPQQDSKVCLKTSQSQDNSDHGDDYQSRQTLGEMGATSRRTAFFNRQEWKTDRSNSDESIHNFEKKGSGIYQANTNLEGMVVRELMRDMTRQMFIRGEGNKREEKMSEKYNKKIKEALLYSKLKARPKRK